MWAYTAHEAPLAKDVKKDRVTGITHFTSVSGIGVNLFSLVPFSRKDHLFSNLFFILLGQKTKQNKGKHLIAEQAPPRCDTPAGGWDAKSIHATNEKRNTIMFWLVVMLAAVAPSGKNHGSYIEFVTWCHHSPTATRRPPTPPHPLPPDSLGTTSGGWEYILEMSNRPLVYWRSTSHTSRLGKIPGNQTLSCKSDHLQVKRHLGFCGPAAI